MKSKLKQKCGWRKTRNISWKWKVFLLVVIYVRSQPKYGQNGAQNEAISHIREILSLVLLIMHIIDKRDNGLSGWKKYFGLNTTFFSWWRRQYLKTPLYSVFSSVCYLRNLPHLLFDVSVEGQTNKVFSFRIFEPLLCDSSSGNL